MTKDDCGRRGHPFKHFSSLSLPKKEHFSLLFVSSDKFPPFRSDVKVLFGQKLAGRGHRIDWVLQSDAAQRRGYETAWLGSRVLVGPTDLGTSRIWRLRKHYRGLRNDWKLVRLLRENHFDFVQVKDKFFAALFALLAVKRTNTVFVYWLSYPIPEASLQLYREGKARYPIFYLLRGWFLKVLLYKVILPRARHIFVQSDQMKRDVAAEGIAPEKMTSVPMGVNIESIRMEPDDQCSEDCSEKLVVYLGTLSRFRRIDFLVRMFAKVHRKVPEARLYLVGSGDDQKDEEIIRREVRRLGLSDAVIVTGFLPMEEAWAYVRKAAVCLSPFAPCPILNSTSPTKLVEYMAMGKAVVANDHPEQQQVLSDSGGGFCVPYEEDRFAEAVLQLLSNPNAAQKMGQLGRAYVEEVRDYERIADIVEAKYLELLEEGEGTSPSADINTQ